MQQIEMVGLSLEQKKEERLEKKKKVTNTECPQNQSVCSLRIKK